MPYAFKAELELCVITLWEMNAYLLDWPIQFAVLFLLDALTKGFMWRSHNKQVVLQMSKS